MPVSPAEDGVVVDLVVGDAVFVSLIRDDQSGAADPFLRILDPLGVGVAMDNDSGGGRDAAVSFVAGQSGVFTVLYSSLGAFEDGLLKIFVN